MVAIAAVRDCGFELVDLNSEHLLSQHYNIFKIRANDKT